MTLDIMVITNTVITIFILVIIGYAAVKLGWLREGMTQGITDFVIKVAQPFMIINAILSIPYSTDNIRSGFIVIAVGVLVQAIAAGIAFVAARPIKDKAERKMSEFCSIFSNCGFMGFPILEAIFGDIGVFWGSFFVISFNLVMWTYGMFILGRANNTVKMNPRKIFLNFGTVPCILGVLIYVLQVPIPVPVSSAAVYISNLCTPLAMIIIGALLARIPIKAIFNKPKTYYICAIKLLVVPLATLLLTWLFRLPSELAVFSVIIMALPSASNAAMFAESYEIVPEYSATIVGVSTLISVGTIPLMLWLTGMVFTL